MTKCPVETKREIAGLANSMRHFMRGKPTAVRHAATTAVYNLIAIARGTATTDTYAALGDNIKRMGGK